VGSGLITRLREYEEIMEVVTENFSKYLYMDAGSNVWLSLIKSKADEVSNYYPSFCAFYRLADAIGQGSSALFVGWKYINLWDWREKDTVWLKETYYDHMDNIDCYGLVKKIKMLFKVIDKQGFELPLEILEYREKLRATNIVEFWIRFLCEALKHIALDEDSYTKIGLCKHPGCDNYFIQTGRGSRRLYCLKHSPKKDKKDNIHE